MKYLEPIKLAVGLILISIGIYFGFKLISETHIPNPILVSVAYGGEVGKLIATYTPVYAGMCLLSGVYMLSKVNR